MAPGEQRWCYAWELCREAFKGAKFDLAGGRPTNSDQRLDMFLLLKDAGLEKFQGMPWLKIPTKERRAVIKKLMVRPTEDPTRDVANTLYHQTDDTKETFSVYFGPTYSRKTEQDRFNEWLTKQEKRHRCSPGRGRDPFAMLRSLAAHRLQGTGLTYKQISTVLGIEKTGTDEISNLRSDVSELRKALEKIRALSWM